LPVVRAKIKSTALQAIVLLHSLCKSLPSLFGVAAPMIYDPHFILK